MLTLFSGRVGIRLVKLCFKSWAKFTVLQKQKHKLMSFVSMSRKSLGHSVKTIFHMWKYWVIKRKLEKRFLLSLSQRSTDVIGCLNLVDQRHRSGHLPISASSSSGSLNSMGAGVPGPPLSPTIKQKLKAYPKYDLTDLKAKLLVKP